MATALTSALLTAGGLANAASPSGDGQDRRVRVHNETGLALQSLQAVVRERINVCRISDYYLTL